MIPVNFEIFGREYGTPPILDGLSTAKIAFSLRKIRTAYSGYCVKVRRSSDNTEQDIGFVGGVLDTSSLLAFVGSGNGFVTKWYDQSGSGNDAYQTAQVNQPIIVESGAVVLENGKPTIKFTTDHRLEFIPFATPQVSVYTVHRFKVGTPAYGFLIGTVPAVGRGFTVRNDYGWPGTDTIIFYNNSSSVDNHATGVSNGTLPTPYRSLIWHNNGTIASASGSQAYTQGASYNEQYGYYGLWGSGVFAFVGYGANLSVGEIVIWASDERADNNRIMEDMRQFYSLY